MLSGSDSSHPHLFLIICEILGDCPQYVMIRSSSEGIPKFVTRSSFPLIMIWSGCTMDSHPRSHNQSVTAVAGKNGFSKKNKSWILVYFVEFRYMLLNKFTTYEFSWALAWFSNIKLIRLYITNYFEVEYLIFISFRS